MMKKMKITQMDYIKANRKASRDEEIAEHGWPSRQHAIHKSKKVYDRKRMKAGLKDLPFHLSIAIKTRETTRQRGGSGCAVVQVGRRSAVGEMGFSWLCVDVVVYIEGYIFVF